MRRSYLLIATLIACNACQSESTPFTEEHRAALADSVDMVVDEYYDAWGSNLDYDRGMSFFPDVPEAAWSQDGSTIYTLAHMDSAWRPIFAELSRQEWRFTDSRTIVLDEDLAYTIREAAVVPWNAAGQALEEATVVETLVWARINGDWKVLLGHGSHP